MMCIILVFQRNYKIILMFTSLSQLGSVNCVGDDIVHESVTHCILVILHALC